MLELIDQHVKGHGIDPKAPATLILDDKFEERVAAYQSTRTRALEMEHAARHNIETAFQQDPAHYKKLSKRLEEALKKFAEDWEQLALALQVVTQEVRQGRPQDSNMLNPQTEAPFLGILLEEQGAETLPSREELHRLAQLTKEMVAHVRQTIQVVDFWRNRYAENVLRVWAIQFLDEHDALPLERQRAAADRLLELSNSLRARPMAQA